MTNSSNRPSATGGGGGPEPARKPVFIVLALAAIAAALGAVLYFKRPAPSAPPVSAEPVVAPAPAETLEKKPVEVAVTEPAPVVTPPPKPVTPPAAPPAPPPVAPRTDIPAAPAPQPSGYTRQLIANLTQIDPSRGPVTPEQAAQWKEEFQKLVKEGAGAVPAIGEFLARNVDLSLEALQGGDQLGAASLRTAMFDALTQIGGPEAISLAAQTLQTTADPREIALLARSLDQMAPEQYREAAVSAAREALAQALKNTESPPDVGPLFEVLQKFGGAQAAPELEQAATRWNYYSTLSLAALPEGAGIPSLSRMAHDPEGGFKASSRFAMQMLAQMAGEHPEAANALLDLARANKVPSSAWYGIISALSGTQMYYGGGYFDPLPAQSLGSEPKAYHIAFSRQNYRSLNVAGSWTPDQVQRQLSFVDQLRAANTEAAQALESTRAALAARLGQ